MAADLILINGLPGSGKTTVSRKLRDDLSLPLVAKDYLKEALYDELGHGDRDWSYLLGRISSESLIIAIDSFMEAGRSLIAESAYYREFTADRIATMIEKYSVNCIELYCQTEPEEWMRRFEQRSKDGSRHPGHLDAHIEYSDELVERYAPLDIGQTIVVNTTNFGDTEYEALLARLKGELHA